MTVLSTFLQRTAMAAALALPLAFGDATTSHATAMFSAAATVTIEVTDIVNTATMDATGIGDVEIGADVFPIDADVFFLEGSADGSASAMGSPESVPPDFDLVPLAIGDSLSIMVSVSGTADPFVFTPDAFGHVDAIAFGIGFIGLENLSLTETFEVFFKLTFSLTADASLDDPVNEDALGAADVLIDSDSGLLIFDEIVEADALFGIFDPDVIGMTTFSLVLGPEGFDDILAQVGVDGFAVVLPEPGTLALFGLGLAGLGLARRRRLI